jgi:uncharacterized protein (TIGR02284 family)
MTTTTHDIASVLNSLIETCKDGQEGFRSAAEHVKNPDMAALFRSYSAQRQQFVAELQSHVRGLGEGMEKSGSVAGALHRGWINLKAAITAKDEHAILAECERGEDSAVAEYREALGHSEMPAELHGMIARQAASVQEAHDRVRDLRDSYQK